VGHRLHELVTEDSVGKIEAALADAASKGTSAWRQVNHPLEGRPDRPIRYMFARLDNSKRFLAIGRDMEADSVLQRRLIEAQQKMEREYLRLRASETRYRLLFSQSTEAIVVADLQSQRVVEMNASAALLFGLDAEQCIGKAVSRLFDSASQSQLKSMFSHLRMLGSVEIGDLTAQGSAEALTARATTISQGRESHALMRFFPSDEWSLKHHNSRQSGFLEVIDAAPEAFAVVDTEGTILLANAALAELTQMPRSDSTVGERISRWLGRPGAEWPDLLKIVEKDGTAKFFSTSITGDLGTTASIELSAVLVPNTNPATIGLVMRNVDARLGGGSIVAHPILPSSSEQMRELVGRVSLKELVRETTDEVERMCIETALDMADDNRASAAEMLGMSRQSLYVKLRRYGLDIGDSDSED
jgi:transcriptional regulator PpsR